MRAPIAYGVCLAAAAGAVSAGELPKLPSGLEPELMEAFVDVKPDGVFTYARFRFLAPQIGAEGAPALGTLAEDFMVLCRDYALARLADGEEEIDRVVISYSDRPLEFGVSDPDAVQFFEQFSITDGACNWEQF